MKYINKILGLSLLGLSLSSNAGLFQTTVHSRANCLNNESITWWLGHAYNWRVVSVHKHFPTNSVHLIDTDFIYNDRVAAIHWGEGVHGGFGVWGYHYLLEYNSGIPFDQTYAVDCSIIDGW